MDLTVTPRFLLASVSAAIPASEFIGFVDGIDMDRRFLNQTYAVPVSRAE